MRFLMQILLMPSEASINIYVAGLADHMSNNSWRYDKKLEFCRTTEKYSQTCIKRPPKGLLKSGLIIQVVA